MDIDPNCIFCSIANKTVASNILHETDNVLIFQDIMPKAPVHVQVISRKHIPTMNELTKADSELISEMILTARDYASEAGIAEKGYKLVWNNGKEGGQIIQHLHIHLLGGKQLEE
ncbi:MAG TPA: histidine triad nucleotide-binding protein [Patescibacteria group bacterium]|jgi:histidine triad (HIT) family protein|nr:histidine triad nucleotide-binding protein [Patescibacteria group bacterium]